MFKHHLRILLQLFLAFGVSSALAGAYEDFFKSTINDDARTVEQLLARGFDVNSRDPKGQNLLYLSQRDGAAKVAQVLLGHPDLRIDLANNAGETPLMMAALRGRLDLAKQLVSRGAKINLKGWTPLHYACSGPDNGVADWLLSQGADIDARAPNGSTPLMMAVRYAPIATAELLLAKGANARLSHENGNTAADFAAGAGREALASKVLAAAR